MTPIMNSSAVGEVEELSELKVTHCADISASGFFLVFSSVLTGKAVGFIFIKKRIETIKSNMVSHRALF